MSRSDERQALAWLQHAEASVGDQISNTEALIGIGYALLAIADLLDRRMG